MPVVKVAKAPGYYVITCGYLLDNIALVYSDKYKNHSTIDKDAILEDARCLGIDGIMTYTDSSAEEALNDKEFYTLPVIVKPVDASGSKCVTKVECWDELQKAKIGLLGSRFQEILLLKYG